MSASLLMVVPTFNEVDNLESVVRRLHRAVPRAHVLVVDDASPDGTGELADRLSDADPRVHVLHRAGKEGLGKAYLAGFEWALARDYSVIGEIDADGSHQPEQLPTLVRALDAADLVIGSRWVPGGAIRNWDRRRELLSRLGNLYTRRLLEISVRDVTAGYRLFRRETLLAVDLPSVTSSGYVFQADLTLRTLRAGGRVIEVPIEFVERTRGESKMTTSVAVESLVRITRWGIREHLGRGQSRETVSPAPPTGTAAAGTGSARPSVEQEAPPPVHSAG